MILKNMVLAACILFSISAGAQTVDTVKYQSAKDYIKAKEETDPNMTRPPKQEIKINSVAPETKKATIKKKKYTCRKKKRS